MIPAPSGWRPAGKTFRRGIVRWPLLALLTRIQAQRVGRAPRPAAENSSPKESPRPNQKPWRSQAGQRPRIAEGRHYLLVRAELSHLGLDQPGEVCIVHAHQFVMIPGLEVDPWLHGYFLVHIHLEAVEISEGRHGPVSQSGNSPANSCSRAMVTPGEPKIFSRRSMPTLHAAGRTAITIPEPRLTMTTLAMALPET